MRMAWAFETSAGSNQPTNERQREACASRPRSVFSSTVSRRRRLNCWNTKPMRARTRRSASGEAPITASSPIRTSPAVGVTSPFRQRSRVDFPAPLEPMRATNSPGPMSRSTPSSVRGPPG